VESLPWCQVRVKFRNGSFSSAYMKSKILTFPSNLGQLFVKSNRNYLFVDFRRFFFGKIPPGSEQNCTINYDEFIKYTDKSFTSRWYCSAQFDLFFPEPVDAPYIVYHSQLKKRKEMNLFDISHEYLNSREDGTEFWGKLLAIFVSN